MAALRSLLEVYGAFDQAILESDDPAIAAQVDDFLPGASANPGWYGQLETFFFGNKAKSAPNLADAVTHIQEEHGRGRRLTVPQQSRLAFALGALTKLHHVAAPLELPVFQGFTDEVLTTGLTVLRLLRPEQDPPPETEPPKGPSPSGGPVPSGGASSQPVKRVSARQLAVKKVAAKKAPAKKAPAKKTAAKKTAAKTAPAGETPENIRAEGIRASVTADLNLFTDYAISNFSSAHDFNSFRGFAIENKFVDDRTRHVPVCRSSLATVDGYQAVVVDTVCHNETLSLTELKAIVNPYNWKHNYNDFFCNMAFCGDRRPDGWGRVLETVGFCEAGVNSLRTALRYYPYDGKHGEARLDYDLDDPTPGPGDGQVRVDRGFINMWSTSPGRNPAHPGVRVRTRKVVHIHGLLPYAQARLVCITGYGTASAQFLFGDPMAPFVGAQAQDPPQPAPFKYLGPTAVTQGQTGPATQTPPGTGQQSDHFAPTAVRIWADTAKGLTDDYLDFAGKWTAGGLTLTDVADYSTTITGRLINAPLAFLQAMSGSRYPDKKPSGPKKGGVT